MDKNQDEYTRETIKAQKNDNNINLNVIIPGIKLIFNFETVFFSVTLILDEQVHVVGNA